MRCRTLTSAVVCAAAIAPGSAHQTDPARGPDGTRTETTTLVERMARVGRAYSPTFSPDGKQLALVSDLNGTPQLWIMPTDGGWPRLVTAGSDPVGGVQWSPTNDWLAFSVLPGGGLNSQIYVIRATGTHRNGGAGPRAGETGAAAGRHRVLHLLSLASGRAA